MWQKTAGIHYPRFFVHKMDLAGGHIMSWSRITIVLEPDENSALRALAKNEFREPRAQAALIIRAELVRRGLLVIEEPQPSVQKQLVSSGEARGRVA